MIISALEERLSGLEAKVRECSQEIDYKSRQLSEAWQVSAQGGGGGPVATPRKVYVGFRSRVVLIAEGLVC